MLTPKEISEILQWIKMLAPEFKGIHARELRHWIEFCEPMIGRKEYGKLYSRALALLACHKMKLNGLGNNEYGTIAESMRLSSVSEGDSSVSFNGSQSPTAETNAEFTLTSYGLQFNDIKLRVIFTGLCGGMRT